MCPIAVVHREPAGQPPSKQAQNRRRDASERRATVRDGALGIAFKEFASDLGADSLAKIRICLRYPLTTHDTASLSFIALAQRSKGR